MNADDLGRWWPEVARRLHAGLGARGVAQADIADIVQETAARALACPPDAADADALSRWAFTVGWRIFIDNSRRSRSRGASVAPDIQGGDVAGIVEHRLRWQKTVRAMAALSPADRAALSATLGPATAESAGPADRRTAVRDAVRLHRARTRLVAMMAKLGTAAAAGWRAVRRVSRTLPAQFALAAAVVALLFTTLEATRPERGPEPGAGGPGQAGPAGPWRPLLAAAQSPTAAAAGRERVRPAAAGAATAKGATPAPGGWGLPTGQERAGLPAFAWAAGPEQGAVKPVVPDVSACRSTITPGDCAPVEIHLNKQSVL